MSRAGATPATAAWPATTAFYIPSALRTPTFGSALIGRSEATAPARSIVVADNTVEDGGHITPAGTGVFVQEAYNRHSMILVEKPWIDTITDIRFPDAIKTRNLKHLAAEHNFLPGFSHRAVFDVLTMLKILSQYDLDAVIARAAEPTLFVQALVTFDQKEMAKELGFHWFAPDKIWWRSMKSSDFEAMKPTCGFQTRLLAGPLE